MLVVSKKPVLSTEGQTDRGTEHWRQVNLPGATAVLKGRGCGLGTRRRWHRWGERTGEAIGGVK